MTLTSHEPNSDIELVSLANPEGPGTKMKNPASVPLPKMRGKALRVSATGKAPEYWFTPSETGRRVAIKVTALKACNTTMADTNHNRPVRLLMKAYGALTSEDFNVAHALSQKAAEIDSTLAAPYIIGGLAYYHEGKKEEARVSFNKARALDPEDNEILQLLRLVE